MNPFFQNLKREAEQNPTFTIGALAALGAAAAKLVQAHGNTVGSRAYKRQVNHRIRQDKKRNK